jgi:hypothetical protein
MKPVEPDVPGSMLQTKSVMTPSYPMGTVTERTVVSKPVKGAAGTAKTEIGLNLLPSAGIDTQGR